MIRMRFDMLGLLMLALAVCAPNISAAPPTITASASTSSVQVAEPFKVQWTVTAPSGVRVTFPDNGKQLGEFDILDTTDHFDVPQSDSSDRRVWTRRMTLETVFTGDQQIPELEVFVRSKGTTSESSEVLRSEALTIHVASVLEDRADPTKFRDIESVVDVDVPVVHSRAWVGWTLGGVSALAAFVFTGVVISKRRRTVTPKTWALNELDDLESSLDAGHADMESATEQLSDILRGFLLLQLDIPESGLTSHEVVDEIASLESVDGQVITRLKELFTQTDTAKFAGLQMSRSEIQDAVENARGIVQTIAISERK